MRVSVNNRGNNFKFDGETIKGSFVRCLLWKDFIVVLTGRPVKQSKKTFKEETHLINFTAPELIIAVILSFISN